MVSSSQDRSADIPTHQNRKYQHSEMLNLDYFTRLRATKKRCSKNTTLKPPNSDLLDLSSITRIAAVHNPDSSTWDTQLVLYYTDAYTGAQSKLADGGLPTACSGRTSHSALCPHQPQTAANVAPYSAIPKLLLHFLFCGFLRK